MKQLNWNDIINGFIKFLPTLIVAIVAPIATLGVAKINRGSKREIDLINELQEQLDKQSVKLESLEKKFNISKDYNEELRKWISTGQPPPPPKYPEGL